MAVLGQWGCPNNNPCGRKYQAAIDLTKAKVA